MHLSLQDGSAGILKLMSCQEAAGIAANTEKRAIASQLAPDFKALFESAAGLCLVLDLALCIIAVSDAFVRATMTRREDILGRDIFEIFPETTEACAAFGMANLNGSLQRVLHSGAEDVMPVQKFNIRRFKEKSGGEERYWKRCNSPVFAKDGSVAWIIHRIEDASEYAELKQAREEIAALHERLRVLGESEERFREVIQHVDGVFWIADVQQDQIIFVSAGYEKTWKRTCDSLYAAPRTWLDAIHPDDHERIFQAVRHKQLIGEYDEEYRIILPDGSARWIQDRAFPIPDSKGVVYRVAGIAVDITERKEVEEALQKKEERLRLALDVSHLATWDWHIPSGWIEWNEEHYRMMGCKPGCVTPSYRVWADHVHPDDLPSVETKIQRAMEQGGDYSAEFRTLGPDGTICHIEALGRFERDAAGYAVRSYGVMIDCTERVRGELERRELQRSTTETLALLDTLQYHAPIGIAFIDPEFRFMRVNEELAAINGIAASAHIGRAVVEVVPELWPRIEAACRQVLENGEPVIETELAGETRARPGKMRHWLVSYYPVRLDHSIAGVGLIVIEVTERKRLEQEVLEISGREQRRIGQDLHDDVCQWLAGIQLLSFALAKDLAEVSPVNAPRALKIAENMGQALSRARMLARGLTPAIIDSEGLSGALHELAANAEEMFHIRCFYECAEILEVRNKIAALHLYRIAQEAISNAVRHGSAGEICITLESHENRVSMLIRNNGISIPYPLPQTSGMGLRTMRYRAGMIGATLEIHPGASGGTEVTCIFPKKL